MKKLIGFGLAVAFIVPGIAMAVDYGQPYQCSLTKTSSKEFARGWMSAQLPSASAVYDAYNASGKYQTAMTYATCVRHANIVINGWPMRLW